MPIIAADFYRMTGAIHTALASIGITQVEQLAAMTAAEIDALPVKGIGKVLSAKWREIALRLVDQQKISERSVKSAPVVVGAPILETITPVDAIAPPVVTKAVTFMAIPALVTCDSLCSLLASKLTMEVVGSTLQLKCDGVVIASAPLPGAQVADLALTKTGPTTGKYDEVLTFTLDVSNMGQANADGTKVCDTLPAGLTFVSATPAPTTTSPLCWDLGTLAPGAAQSITYQARVTDAAITLTNAAEATTTSVEGDYTNNTGAVSVTIPAHCTSTGTILGNAVGPFSAGPCTAQATLAALQACLQAAGFTVTLTPTGTTSAGPSTAAVWNPVTVANGATTATWTNTQNTVSVTETTGAGSTFTGSVQQTGAGTFQHPNAITPTGGTPQRLNFAVTNTSANSVSPTIRIDYNSGSAQFNANGGITFTFDANKFTAATSTGTVVTSGVNVPATGIGALLILTPKPGVVLAPGETTTINYVQSNSTVINAESVGIGVSTAARLPDQTISITGTTTIPSVTTGSGTVALSSTCI